MIVHQAFRYELDPNAAQRVLLAKHAGCARFAWNWALGARIRRYRECAGRERFTNAIEQHRELNARKSTAWPWMYEVSKCAPQEALRNLDRAFRNFLKARQAGRSFGFPRFLGLNSFAAISDGVCERAVSAPKPLGRSLGLLRRRSRAHSRKARGSGNRRRSALRLARLHRRIRNVRTDYLHKLSTTLAKTKSVVVLEDLTVTGMLRNRHLARHISDAGWGAFRRMLEYKSRWYGSKVVVAPRFLASSKTCSNCGHVLESLALSVRKWACAVCGVEHDRDANAARNLVAWYRLATGSSPGRDACGEPSGGAKAQASASHGSAKQESATEDLAVG